LKKLKAKEILKQPDSIANYNSSNIKRLKFGETSFLSLKKRGSFIAALSASVFV